MLYASHKKQIHDVALSGKMCILDMEIEGIQQMKSVEFMDCICVFISPPSIEALDRRLRDRGHDDEESIQKKINRAVSEIEMSKEKDLFQHIIVNDDLSACLRNILDIVSESWPRSIVSSTCNTAIKEFEFKSQNKIQPSLRRLGTDIEQTIVMDFVRGSHTLQMNVDNNFAYYFNVNSMTSFDLDYDYKILKEKKNFMVYEVSGSYQNQVRRISCDTTSINALKANILLQDPGIWNVWFRRTVNVANETLLTLRMYVADIKMKAFVQLMLINNDDESMQVIYVTTETDPILISPNKGGYNLVAISRNNSSDMLPESAWKFIVYSDVSDVTVSECLSDNKKEFTDNYAPNSNFLLCRYILKPDAWTQISFMAEALCTADVSARAGMVVCIIKTLEEAVDPSKVKEGTEIPPQHLKYEVIRSWSAVRMTVFISITLQYTDQYHLPDFHS